MARPVNGFTKSQRLIKAADYRQVFNSSRRYSNRFFTLLVRDNHSDGARLGLAISKKHISLATQRNLIKRITREIFRHHQDNIQGMDVVVLTRKQTRSYSNKLELKTSLELLFQKIK